MLKRFIIKREFPALEIFSGGRAVQPGGRLVAYITGDADRTHNLTLKLLSLPDGGAKTITRLTNAGTEPGNEAMLDSRIEAVRAISLASKTVVTVRRNRLVFTPDERKEKPSRVEVMPPGTKPVIRELD